MQQLVFVLGREPHLSVAEIAAVIGDGAEWTKAELSAEALVTSCTGVMDANTLMARLGGTIKIGEVWREVETRTRTNTRTSERTTTNRIDASSSWFSSSSMTQAIGRYILDQTIADRKVHFGYSVYDLGDGAARVRGVRESLRRGAAAQKAWLTERERKVRWVTSREPTLSSVIVTKNDLLPDRNGVEVLVLIASDHIVLARTLAVQPFEEWGRRDYGRPSRDARSGMLPPKLARAMVNLALRQAQGITIVPERAKRVEGRSFTLLDPFCGSGTILTEAMALGVPKIIGTDVSTEATEDARANVEWTRKQYSLSGAEGGVEGRPSTSSGHIPSVTIQRCDARQLSQCVHERVDVIVTEPFLGPPVRGEHRRLRSPAEPGGKPPVLRSTLGDDLRTLYIDAFREFAKVLTPGGCVVFIVPVFREREVVLDITRDVARFGFHRIKPFPAPLHDHPILRSKADLPYARSDQRVGRRILTFVFKPRSGG